MSGRTLHFAAHGFRSQEVEIAPEALDARSKRTGLIEKEDSNLNRNLGDLEEGTRARNRAFQDRLDEVWSLTEAWEAKLRTEAREAVETITNMREDYQRHLDSFSFDIHRELKEAFDKIDNDLLPAATARIDNIEERDDEFVGKTVPDELELTTGEVSRQLKKAYEGFQIEKQKVKIRQNKIVQKASEHVQDTAQRFNDENSLQTACFHNLTDDIINHERTAARMHLRRWDRAQRAVQEMKKEVSMEASFRNEEDKDLLDTIAETQQLLQKTILEHFGSDGDFIPIFPSLDKLAHRMALKDDRQRERDREALSSVAAASVGTVTGSATATGGAAGSGVSESGRRKNSESSVKAVKALEADD